ncbi:helicase [Mycolicibacterium peregrinum]|uniref:DEAD/DEAH box helicase n=1 Tax=Mycolicibacterium peregrinum TaxID=43304 RepID=UPI0006D7D6AD|nr:DEAD/DEAH box helicase [Mycolicibacterium peregrinum]MCV7206362.1 DEAD/DEAH box helicase [Mycolicibacterium peregrinum]ORW54468.1 helicase [Mycolicibacterium peregrinum]OWM10816.1 helicase [Mycolicibacterium peregrinum]
MSEVAAGERIVVRDEEWLVRTVRNTERDGVRVEVTGVSSLVRDQDAVFFGSLDKIDRLDPREGKLVADDSAGFRSSRLWLESVRRGSPAPASETRITVGHRGLLDRMDYQLRPAAQALQNLRPRILIGDAVGLGKTLEVGILLSELIRRGRGERILVVTPRAVLEQFQRELWTRFAIPLIRLDSSGIQKVRQTLPSSRNPFSYYKRVIVSIDTLKNPARYKHHLKSQKWDAVVIDECHNLINRGTLNNELAKLLAAQTDALILASATPHNGKPDSFAELVHLLDPTAIVDRTDYSAKDIEHLYVRRHRNSPDVKLDVAHKWKERQQPRVIEVVPTPAEAEVLRELENTWLHPKGASVISGQGRQLFPWTLFKAFLSSPKALHSSIERRLATIGETAGLESKALKLLDELAEKADASTPSKLTRLVEHLKAVGIAKGSPTRVVVFSERIDTLTWLQQELPKRLKLPAGAVRTLYATLPDDTIQDVVNGFGQASSDIRVLLASDMASEGLNLHQECHQLVHYDLPWSFIRIQQRNGRIDRYGQLHAPEISALALAGEDDVTSDLRVVTKLLQKEYEANRALGDAGVLLDLHDADLEEKAVLKAIREGEDLDDAVPEPTPTAINPFAALMAVGGQHEEDSTPETVDEHSLFEDDDNFLLDELADISGEIGEQKLDVHRDADTDLIAFAPPPDLITRFRDLPSDYIAEQGIEKRLRLTGSTKYAQSRLDRAQALEDTAWPDVHFLAPIHPVLDWAAERAVARFGRNAIPVLSGDVDSPVYLTQAVWANQLGRPAIAHWGAIRGLPDHPDVGDFDDALDIAGITEGATNTGLNDGDCADAQYHIAAAVDAATEHLRDKRDDIEADLLRRIANYRQKLKTWEQAAMSIVEDTTRRAGSKLTITETSDQSLALIDSQAAVGDPFVRVVAVIVPRVGA